MKKMVMVFGVFLLNGAVLQADSTAFDKVARDVADAAKDLFGSGLRVFDKNSLSNPTKVKNFDTFLANVKTIVKNSSADWRGVLDPVLNKAASDTESMGKQLVMIANSLYRATSKESLQDLSKKASDLEQEAEAAQKTLQSTNFLLQDKKDAKHLLDTVLKIMKLIANEAMMKATNEAAKR